MNQFTFFHAADLHIDAPFRGVKYTLNGASPKERNIKLLLKQATSIALARLVDLCIKYDARFLLLAGDIYNSSDNNLHARFLLRNAFKKLNEHGIKVFIVHGNHDPLMQNNSSFAWPENVTVFPETPATHDLQQGDIAYAAIHGISHDKEKETRNLAKLLTRNTDKLKHIFQIGLLHCAVTGASGLHGNYAPCTRNDLATSNMDYWALGHVHTPMITSLENGSQQAPYFGYSGSIQGLHCNETGPRGCLAITVNSGVALPEFVSLAPLQWEHYHLDLTQYPEIVSVQDLEEIVVQKLVEDASQEPERNPNQTIFTGFKPDYRLYRLTLEGHSSLDSILRQTESCEALQQQLNNELETQPIWLHSLKIGTHPPINKELVAQQDNLLGAAYRLSEAIQKNPEEIITIATNNFHPLFKRSKIQNLVEFPDEDEILRALQDAERITFNLLSNSTWK